MNDKIAETLTLLHTNDIHSHFEEAARIAWYFRQMRKETPADRLLAIECGDFLDRVRIETEGTHGMANRAMLEMLAYDAVTLGNNEGLTFTKEQLDALYEGAPFQVVCANLTDSASGERPCWMKPTTVIEKAGWRIGLIGLTAPFGDFYELLGWTAADPFEEAARLVPALRKEADVVIAISHLGLRSDQRLAEEIEGIDIILGAHTHHLLEVPLRIGRTTVCAAGKFGRHLGLLKLTRRDGGGLSVEGGCLPTDGMAADGAFEVLVAESRERADKAMGGTIAVLEEALETALEIESPLGNLLASGVRHAAGAEIGLVNSGQLLGGLPAGPVTARDIHAICPSPINPCEMRLTGATLKRALEESLLPEFIGLEFQGFGFRGKALGTLCVDGVEWSFDESKPPLERTVDILVNGAPLEESREYRVGTLDMFTFGVGYLGLKEGVVERYLLPEFIRDVLAASLNDPARVADCRRMRRRTANRLGG
ncbi:bifunctional metallophosphatase/5'-nucleotidase [Cohnella zeiphila]|uniref:Bifunctional metallophosphatase/5'-nucleotidase n=1 Tax=Cohnella zeiphila TaxID=2761120 RepID=A0A7X0SP06_9BACL|nr:bifunctional UDP-sugar hydrolase/5'-nucleotidase [Cohnella zeiphila]MBB6733505.1 bifunctional metallophosphatase/5'-nucleotidase [Cohnella zeiphila]